MGYNKKNNLRVYSYILIFLGIIFRVFQYLFNRSLWLDEAYLAINIVNRSFVGLFNPLEYGQTAPLGFLLSVKAVINVFGSNEYILRLLPLLAGTISVWLFYKIGQKLFDEKVTLIALAFFSFSDALIYYSSEVKQYIVDVFAALIVYLCYIKFIKNKNINRREHIIYTLLVGLMFWFSQPVIFLVAVLSLLLFCNFVFGKKISLKRLMFTGTIWLISFVINYKLNISSRITDQGLKDYWVNYLAPLPTSINNLFWYKDIFLGFFSYPSGLIFPIIGLIFFIWGSFVLFKKDFKTGVFILLSFLLTIIASMLSLYPLFGRFLLFRLPGTFILISIGLTDILNRKNQYVNTLLTIILLLVFLPIIFTNTYRLFSPRTNEETKPLIKYYQSHFQNGDQLYLYYSSNPAYQYYRQLFHLGKYPYIIGAGRTADLNFYRQDLQKLIGKKRIWFLFSHVATINGVDEKAFYLKILDKTGRLIDSRFAEGASIYLYDLSR